jgi:hypothetical protein
MRAFCLTLFAMLIAMIAPAMAASDAGPVGTYEVVALRRASDVAGGPADVSAADSLGRRARFGETVQWLDGTTCTDWSLEPLADPAVSVGDANLSDLQLAPEGIADARENRSLVLICDGRKQTTMLQVDARVLVVPSMSGLTNLVLERLPNGDDIATIRSGLEAHDLLDGSAAENVMDDATRRALAVYADGLGAAYAFARGAVTENLLAKLAHPAPGDEALKIVISGPVSAHFYGVQEQLAPLEQGVEELRFRFEGDADSYAFKPAGTLVADDWFFHVFSFDGSFVLLPQDHHGPYHVVRVGHLKDYLQGRRDADEVVGGGAGQVHGSAEWLSDTEFGYTATQGGETVEHRHSTRFLDYRPKRTPDTVFDYRPELTIETDVLPDFAAERMAELTLQMEHLIGAAQAKPGGFVAGNVALGANPQEYVPSDEELLAARFGDALVTLLNKMEADQIKAAWTAPGSTQRTLVYYRFIYRHVDVMGSGRFFYASPPIPTVLELKAAE